MKKIIIAALILIFNITAQAQLPGEMNATAKAMFNSGHVYGKIVDSTNKAISDVSVVLLQKKFDTASKKMKDVLLKGLVTKTKGEFDFDELPIQIPLTMKISAITHRRDNLANCTNNIYFTG